MPNVMAAQAKIGGALYESYVISFHSLYHAAKFDCHPLLECLRVTLPIYENARLGCKVNFAAGKLPPGNKSLRKCMHNVPAQETAKHRARFGWPAVNDVVAATKSRRCDFCVIFASCISSEPRAAHLRPAF